MPSWDGESTKPGVGALLEPVGPPKRSDRPVSGVSSDLAPSARPDVRPANAPPTAVIAALPQAVAAGVEITFDGSGSFDSDGYLTHYSWGFGDGVSYEDPIATHSFVVKRTYTVTLVVADDAGASDTTSALLNVTHTAPPPGIVLSDVEHHAGFRIRVPQGWELELDHVVGGNVTELVAEGTYDGQPAEVRVDAIPDASTLESRTYMQEVFDGFLAELQRLAPNAGLMDGPDFGTLSNHSALNFSVYYYGTPLLQRATFVFSDPHDAVWFVLTTMAPTEYLELKFLHDAMLEGFEVVASSSTGGGLPIALVMGSFASAIGLGALVAFAYVRRKRHRSVPTLVTAGPGVETLSGPCPVCATPVPLGAEVCPSCGTSVLSGGEPPGL